MTVGCFWTCLYIRTYGDTVPLALVKIYQRLQRPLAMPPPQQLPPVPRPAAATAAAQFVHLPAPNDTVPHGGSGLIAVVVFVISSSPPPPDPVLVPFPIPSNHPPSGHLNHPPDGLQTQGHQSRRIRRDVRGIELGGPLPGGAREKEEKRRAVRMAKSFLSFRMNVQWMERERGERGRRPVYRKRRRL